MHKYARIKTFFLTLALLSLAGCLKTYHPAQLRTSTATLKEATLQELVDSINTNAARWQSLQATVDIDASYLERKKSRVAEWPQSRGYILVRKPGMLRMKALVPVVRNVAFDMVTNGQTFGLSVPSKSWFLAGLDRQPTKPSPDPIWNLRPQQFYGALLMKAVDESAGEIAVLQEGLEIVKDPKTHKDVQQSDYEVIVLAKDSAGYFLARKIVFSRIDLRPRDQYLYDRQGKVVEFVHYDNFTDHGGTDFPEIINIQLPAEDFAVTLSVVKLNLNEPLTDDQFVLEQPPGSKFINVDDHHDSAESQSALRGHSPNQPEM
jgi:hypothetical protein